MAPTIGPLFRLLSAALLDKCQSGSVILQPRTLKALTLCIRIFVLLVMLSPQLAAQKIGSPSESDWMSFEGISEQEVAGDIDGAVESLKSMIADSDSHPQIVSTAREYLSYLCVENNRPQEAVDQLAILLSDATDPFNQYDFLHERSRAYSMLGNSALAEADRLAAAELLKSFSDVDEGEAVSIPYLFQLLIKQGFHKISPNGIESTSGKFLISGFLAFGLWLLIVPYNLWMGNRQRIEGEGTWKRLWCVSSGMALIQSLPLQFMVLFCAFSTPESDIESLIFVAIITFVLVLFWCGLYLLPPTRFVGVSEGLPKVEDSGFCKRLDVMSKKLGIQTPVARIIPSAGGTMALQGFAGGLPHPSLTISDGILMRLSEEETDAIVAHELGHIANYSLWFFPIVVSVSWTSGVIAALWFGVWASLLIGCAMQTGVSRIVSRYFEYNSDRKAAGIVGYVATVTALDKIHITNIVGNTGWASFFAYSMATHPSHEERLSALANAAPVTDRPEVTWSEKTAKRRRMGSRVAFFIWLSIMVCSIVLPAFDIWVFLRLVMLCGVVFTPSFLIQKAIRKDVKADLKRRQVQTKTKSNWVVYSVVFMVATLIFSMMSLAGADFITDHGSDQAWLILLFPLGIATFLFVWMVWKNSRSPEKKIRLAIHQKRWQDALALGEENLKKIKGNTALRHDLILARWMAGEEEAAIAAMAQLREDVPSFKHPWLMEGMMHLERGEYQTALDLVNEVKDDLEGDVSPHGIAARCYRFLDQLEQMEEEANAIENIIAEIAGVPAFRCAVAIDRGESELARSLWEQADRLAPGDIYIYLLKAELEFRFGSQDEGQQYLTTAKGLIDATPFAFLGAELRYVEALANDDASAEK